MIADELARARDACDALRSDDPLRPEMRSLLDTIGKRLEGNEGASRGRRPALPDDNPLHVELTPAQKEARKLAQRAKKKTDPVHKMRSNRFGVSYMALTMEKHEQEQRDREHERLKLLEKGIPKRSQELRFRQREQVSFSVTI